MSDKSERAKKEEKILQFWKENKIFEKSLEKESPKGELVFYDGPPFATGLPHYGHILAGTIKDVVPRYKTMQGFHLSRRWGWDCHGLPIENLIEKELGLETKKDIEKFGIAEFNKHARESVFRFEKDWKEIIPRTGRWVDMEHSYKTMDAKYTESVWWSFKQLYEKGLVYQGFKSMHLCPRCETTLSNFEVNLGYKDITDISVYVKFELVDEPGTYLLAWTTTPWTLPGNVALAVNPNTEYIKYRWAGDTFIVSKKFFDSGKYPSSVSEQIPGRNLVGKRYKTLFDYYLKESQVYGAEFVTSEDGTGIVHIAPAFGEDDYNLSLKEKLPFLQHVGTDGKFKPETQDFAGELAKPKDNHQATDIKIIKYLAGKNALFAKEKIVHSYPHCWRCDTPLLNYASSSWFVKVTKLKNKLVQNNKNVKWVPRDIRDGRFGKWLEGARDWAISRSRFWGTPLPVWRNADGSKSLVVDSIEILKKYIKKSGNKYFIMRHGESDNLVKGVPDMTGDPNNHLTEKGTEEVRGMIKELKKIDLIISSPFQRTHESAEIVKKELGLPDGALQIEPRLHEMEEDENVPTLRCRMGEVLFDIDHKHKDKTILLVSHGMPLWVLQRVAEGKQSDDFKPGEQLKPAEVVSISFVPYPHNENYELDLHRPYIDEVVLEKSGEEYRRVPEIFDTWYDSGSVPFASRGTRDYLPADFIAEGLDQTRGWFYTMIVLSTALFNKSPYRQVIVNGLILAEDGKKMSKRLKNYPELTYVLDKYGADALRYYLMSSPAVRAEDLAFSEKSLDEIAKKNLTRLENVVSFYELYAEGPYGKRVSKNVLDSWIDARLTQLIADVTEGLDKYELDRASRPIADFIDDLSTWYLRRSRNRPDALPKLREILLTLAKILAPFMPFIAEDIYLKLRGENDPESVHLCGWPAIKRPSFSLFRSSTTIILKNMEETRHLVSLALEARAKANIKVRQPLSELKIKNTKLSEEFLTLIREELNVKRVTADATLVSEAELDTSLTDALIEEGKVRDAIRAIQDIRKEKGLTPKEKMSYLVPEQDQELFARHAGEIKKATNIEF
ncbi:MAG: class I tRNA ligase family protein [Patescibacteria group bacterium]